MENEDLKKQKELTWLEHLQRNSWEPEVIISGITLAFLFSVPDQVYRFSAMLVQDYGVPYLASAMILLYLNALVSVFKIFFVFHLILRFVWAGLLGLSYAFPQGVIHENLFSRSRNLPYQTPENMVLRMERICSMAFAYPISLVIVFVGITLLLGIAISVYLWVDVSFFFVYLLGMALLVGISLFLMLGRQSKVRVWYAQTLVSSVAAIYQSNLGKWFTVGYGALICGLATPLVIADTRDFSLFFNEVNLNENEMEWPAKSLYFEHLHDPERRYARIILPNEEISDKILRIGLARYEEDGQILARIQTDFEAELAVLGWPVPKETAGLHRIYIDEKPVSGQVWRKERLPLTRQKILQSYLNVDSLSEGFHRIRVEKLTLEYHLFSNKPQLKLLENWALVDFIKI
jgi:hypothetical protein